MPNLCMGKIEHKESELVKKPISLWMRVACLNALLFATLAMGLMYPTQEEA